MRLNHVVIWIDHKEAHVLHYDNAKSTLIKSQSKHPHLHHKANAIGSGKAPDDHQYFHNVMAAVVDADEILIVGPGSAKSELLKHAIGHDAQLSQKIIGLETTDHPTDPQVIAFAKKYFYRIDKMKGDIA